MSERIVDFICETRHIGNTALSNKDPFNKGTKQCNDQLFSKMLDPNINTLIVRHTLFFSVLGTVHQIKKVHGTFFFAWTVRTQKNNVFVALRVKRLKYLIH